MPVGCATVEGPAVGAVASSEATSAPCTDAVGADTAAAPCTDAVGADTAAGASAAGLIHQSQPTSVVRLLCHLLLDDLYMLYSVSLCDM